MFTLVGVRGRLGREGCERAEIEMRNEVGLMRRGYSGEYNRRRIEDRNNESIETKRCSHWKSARKILP